RLGLSGIITVVVYAISVARTAPDVMPARLRIPSYAVWEVAVFVLNVLAFILVGLQLKPILQRLDRAELITYATAGAAVCAAVIVVRIVWVMGYAAVGRWTARLRPKRSHKPRRYPSYRVGAVIAWCGMRGIVTIAAALALPDGRSGQPPFPYRDLILFVAFCVVLGTLVLQGLTVTPLMKIMRLQADDTVEREVRLARLETARAGLTALERSAVGDEMVALLRRKYEVRVQRAESGKAAVESADGDARGSYAEVQQRAQAAERHTLSQLRTSGTIGDDAFHRVEEELDWAEVNAQTHRVASSA
ncbi:MAG: cation:proton antiporter, partial [Gemmatimonadales bacterium]